jgi:hypothetical protein
LLIKQKLFNWERCGHILSVYTIAREGVSKYNHTYSPAEADFHIFGMSSWCENLEGQFPQEEMTRELII